MFNIPNNLSTTIPLEPKIKISNKHTVIILLQQLRTNYNKMYMYKSLQCFTEVERLNNTIADIEKNIINLIY